MEAIVSVIGSHGGNDFEEILGKKISDIQNIGFCFWMTRSLSIKPELVSPLGETACFFIKASGVSASKPFGGANPTLATDISREFSIDLKSWSKVPECFSVTGKISDGLGRAIVIKNLERCNFDFDLWEWSQYYNSTKSLNFRPWNSSIISIKSPSKDKLPKSRIRNVVARAVTVSPFCVWLR